MKNMVVRELEGFKMVVLLGPNNPTDAEWGEALRVGKALLAAVGGDRTRTGAIVFTEGGSPSSRQRQLTRELYGDAPPPMALVTDSLLARGAAAVFKIFWPSTNAVFGSADWEKALRHVNIAPAQQAALLAKVKAMQDELGPLAVTRPLLATAR